MIHLPPEWLAMVQKILRFYAPPGRKVVAFGSRVTGKHLKKHSDLDICVMGDTPLDDLDKADLRDAFSISRLPIRVDIVDWARTDPSFQKIIESQCEEIPY